MGTEERRPALALTTRSSASRITRKSGDRSIRECVETLHVAAPPAVELKA